MHVLVIYCYVSNHAKIEWFKTIYYLAVLTEGISCSCSQKMAGAVALCVECLRGLTHMVDSWHRLLSGISGWDTDCHAFRWPLHVAWVSHSLVAVPGFVLNHIW